jgi:dolichyl-phosphate beta-glucosyltransferase
MLVSVIIPAYNEESRIEHTLENILVFPFWSSAELEILVVDDASRDQTSNIVKAFAHNDSRVRLLRGEVNRGKGFSVRRGMQEARGDYLLFADADNSTPIEEIQKLLPLVKSGVCDIAIGSRGLKESQVRIKQSWIRQHMGKMFNVFVRCLLLKDFRDTQCGFKCFSKKAAQAIFALQRIDRFAFDVEILVIAAFQGFSVKEVPIVWMNSPQSKVSPVRDAARMFWDLLQIKANVLKGMYRKA